MEFKRILEERNIQTYEDVKVFLESEPYHFRLKVDEEIYPSLYCICQSDKTPNNEKWLRECNGLIVEKETNRVVCYTMDKMDESTELTINQDIDMSTVNLGYSLEGALLRVYYYGDKWMVSTKRCVNAKKARWLSKKTFHEMFMETIPEGFMDKLEVDKCYSFILGHPENNMVVQYVRPMLYHLITRDMGTLEEIEVDLGVNKMPMLETRDLEAEMKNLESINWEELGGVSLEGIVITDGNKNRQKFITQSYKRAKELWGETNYRFYRYLEIRKEGNGVIEEYLRYFPHHKDEFVKYEKDFIGLVQFVFDIYYGKHVLKNGKEIPYYLKRLIFDIHGEFLRTKEMTDIVKIMEWMGKLDVKLICHMFNNWRESLKEKSVESAEVEEETKEDVN